MFRSLCLFCTGCVILSLAVLPVSAANIAFQKGLEYDGIYYWDLTENWKDGVLPTMADKAVLGQNGVVIGIDDLDPSIAKEAGIVSIWNKKEITILVTSSVEDGPGGVLTTNDLEMSANTGTDNKLIIDKGVVNATRLRTSRKGKLTTVYIDVNEGGVLNCDLVELTQEPSNPETICSLSVNGGEVNVTGALSSAGRPGNSLLNLNGGTMRLGSFDVGDDFVMDVNGGTLILDGDQAGVLSQLVADDQVTISGVSASRGGLEVVYDAETGKTRVTGDSSVVDPDKAWGQQPAGVAVDVFTAALTWNAGDSTADSQGHVVYFGTDANAVDTDTPDNGNGTYQGTVDTAQMDIPVKMVMGQTYYWRVDEVNQESGEAMKGNLWSFTVAKTSLIEDFESYTGENINDPNAVFNTWEDGIVDASLGMSQSGHNDPPFVDTLDVIEGAQSLPIYYDNNDVITTSEVRYTLPEAQDWTGRGIKALALMVRGKYDNSVGDVYVMINDIKIKYDLSMGHFQAMWTPWIASLANVDASVLSKVSTIKVGIEGANVAGMIAIDNLQLTGMEGETMVAAEPNDKDLVVRYLFDGNALDSSGNDHHCTILGASNWVDGGDGFGTVWESKSSSGAQVASNFDPTGGTGTFTFSVWCRWDGAGEDIQQLFTKADAWDQAEMMFNIELKGPNFKVPTRANRMVMVYKGQTQRDFHEVPAGEWSHNAIVFDGQNVTAYLNGSLSKQSLSTALGPKTDASVYIASTYDNARIVEGLVSDYRFYKKALTQNEIMSLAGRTDEVYKHF